jgi:hypothetical protein
MPLSIVTIHYLKWGSKTRGVTTSIDTSYIVVGYDETFQGCCLYDPTTNMVIEYIEAIFDKVPTHGMLGSFPLFLSEDYLCMVP